jgi:hypothetical protein
MLTTIVLTLTLAATPQGHASSDIGAVVFAKVADSVLLVTVEDDRGEVLGRGSAFVVPGGRLVTNAHVVSEGKIFITGGAFKIPCVVEKLNDELDLAILRPSAELSAQPLVLASALPPNGSTVFALGNPHGLERTISQGLFTGTRSVRTTQMLQVSAAISPGSSGGPVVLPSGEVIGVATLSLKDGQNLNFAVPAAAVRSLMDGEPSAPAVRSEPAVELVAAVLVALEQSKFRYQKAGDGVWRVVFQGDNMDAVPVSIWAADQMVVVSATVKQSPTLTTSSLRALLQANYGADFAKLGLDEDGDLIALTELPADFSSTAFKEAVEQVALLADAAAALVVEAPASAPLANVAAGRGATLPILRGAFELSYDPSKWRVKPSKEAGETELQHVSGDAGVKVISERIEVSRDAFRQVVVENAKALAPDVAVISETPRRINGLDVTLIRYRGTAMGIKVTFLNQMYSDPSGTIQLAAWTGTNLVDEYQRDFLELFAGLRKMR